MAWWLPRMVPRLLSCWQETREVTQIVWRLQALDEADPAWHCLSVLNRQLSHFRRFKVGHTHVPLNRWVRFLRDNQRPARLLFFFVSEDNRESGGLETQLVQGFHVAPRDWRCMNIRPGGELVDLGPPPYFVYLAHGRIRKQSRK